MALGSRTRRAIASAVLIVAVVGAAGATGLSPILAMDPAWLAPVDRPAVDRLLAALAIGFAVGLLVAIAILAPRARSRRRRGEIPGRT